MARSRRQIALPEPPRPEGRQRVFVECVRPELDGGAYPIKRCVGEVVVVEADLVGDGHDAVGGALRFRPKSTLAWSEQPLRALGNDRWSASFVPTEVGVWQYTVEGWVDSWSTWRRGFVRKVEAEQDIRVDLTIGVALLTEMARQAEHANASRDLERLSKAIRALKGRAPLPERVRVALDDELHATAARYPNRDHSGTYRQVLEVVVDPPRAGFSCWYEMFPRSARGDGKHATLREAEGRLDYIASMGFDIVYLPPIHPIGKTFRKGRNNSLTALAGDPGSPWAIGSEEGGHKSVHPELGTLEDFRHFVEAARTRGLAVALDIAFQASPDHPYVKEHPEWFVHRPDGTIQYAENPPKKYQDIYPLNFDCEAWESLWQELCSVFLFWIDQGVSVFRVDNPHTKSFRFWHWCIAEIKAKHPEVLFLSEAFTRPKLMYALAKLGFSQSYTYFTWRNTKEEFEQYLTELTRTEVAEYFRPNFWPNTPDILPEHLQHGGRPAFMSRLVLAATLSSNYGIYGPAFELGDSIARPGSEEYIDNEKYEIKRWELERPDSLHDLIARLNAVRSECAALQSNRNLVFHRTDNPQILCYSKRSDDRSNVMLMVVNLDHHHTQSGWVELDLGELGLSHEQVFQVHDRISDSRYLWRGHRNYVELHNHLVPAHVFQVRRHDHREEGFDYYV